MNALSIIGYSSDDNDTVAALSLLRYLVHLSLCRPFVAVPVEQLQAGDEAEIGAILVNIEGRSEHGLNRLLADQGALDVLRSVTVTTFTKESPQLELVSSGARVLSDRLRWMAGVRVRLVEGRLLVPLTTERLTTDRFFGTGGIVNLIALPEDEVEIDSIPVYADAFTDEQRFAHVAFEIATIAGLWTGMSEAPIDNWGIDAAGTPATRASFVSSAARVILDTSPDLGDALDLTKFLPVPEGYLSLPPFAGLEDQVANEVFPPELVYTAPSAGGFIEGAEHLGFVTLLKEFGRLPTYAWKSVSDDLYESGQENLRNILHDAGFQDVRIRGDAETGQLLTDSDIENIIRSAEMEAAKPRPNPIPGEYWQSLIGRLLAVLDGGEEGIDARMHLSSATQVLTEQARITLPNSDTETVVRTLTRSDSPPAIDKEAAEPEGATGEQSETGEQEAPASDSPTPKPPAQKPATKEKMTSKPRGEVIHRTVLTRVGGLFRESKARATLDVKNTSGNIREIGRELAQWQQLDIVGLIPWVLALAVFMISFAVFALTSWSEHLDEFVYGNLRSTLFAAGAALVLALSGLALLGQSGRTWHRNATVMAVFVGIGIGVLSAFADQILDEANDTLGLFIAGVVLVVALWAIIKANSEGKRATARVIRRVVLFFAAIIAIVGAAREDLAIQQNMNPDDQRRLATALIVAGVMMAIMSAVIVAIARVQQVNAIGEMAGQLEAARHRIIVATDAERRLDSAIHQWSYTGAGLNYLVRYPFGQSKTSERPTTELEEFGLLRFQILALELAEDGRRALVASRLRSSTTPGWLLRQYEMAVDEYSGREARLHGLPPGSSVDFRPDQDEEPLAADTPDSIKDRSPRVGFARWLGSGEADEILASPVVSEDLVDVYRNVLDHESNYRLVMVSGPQSSHTDSMDELFRGVVPDEPRLLPPTLVSKLFSGSGSGQDMRSTIWWPSDLATEEHPDGEYLSWETSVPFTRESGTERLVMQAIRFDRSASFAFHDLVGSTSQDLETPDLPEDEM